jgi:hypothetical protein
MAAAIAAISVRTLPRDAHDDEAAHDHHDEGSAPDEQGLGFERRIEAHEVAVAIGHELEYFSVAVAGHQHLAHLAPQIPRQLRV